MVGNTVCPTVPATHSFVFCKGVTYCCTALGIDASMRLVVLLVSGIPAENS